MAKNRWLSVADATAAIERLGASGDALARWRDNIGLSFTQQNERERRLALAQQMAAHEVAAEAAKLRHYKEAYAAYAQGDRQRGHNNVGDALRHAETSRRIAETVGTVPAYALGTIKELVDTYLEGQPRSEMAMDLHNNAEGRAAARERRPVDMRRLRTEPSGTMARGAYR